MVAAQCRRCGSPRIAERVYCWSCGARHEEPPASGSICPRCETEHERHHSWCGRCGLALTADAPEWRQLTVLFADLAGSTEMSGVLDPEDLREVNRAYQDAVTAAVENAGGFVARYMGDGVLAYFGYPRAYDNDPVRAVRASLDIVSAVEDASRLVGSRLGVAMQVRVGIATGRVVVGDLVGTGAAQEAAVVGATPNLAARLQSIADPNGIVISDATRRRLGAMFRVGSLGERNLKGMPEPVEVFSVLGKADTTETVFTHPLIGRERDVTWLEGHCTGAGQQRARIAVITGEAGMGKSHLIAHATRDHRSVIFRASPWESNRPLSPILAWALERVGASNVPPEQRAQILKAHSWSGSDTGTLLAWALGDTDAVEGEVEELADRLESVLIDEITALAGEPLIVVLEDAHFADPTTLGWMARLRDAVGERPIALVVTTRPGASLPWPTEDISHLRLAAVDDDSRRTLANSVAGGDLPEDVLAEIASRTGGIPLYVEELTRALILSGQLERTSEGWRLQGGFDELAVPDSLQASLMARLDQMGTTKGLAQVASVLGNRFRQPELQAVSGLEGTELAASLEDLVDKAILVVDGDDGFAFRHALLQETAYESLLRSRRRTLHAKAAKFFGESEQPDPADLAYHLAAAGQVLEAARWWVAAAEESVRRDANREAAAFLRTALDGLMHHEPRAVAQELDLRARLAERLRVTGDRASALEVLEGVDAVGESAEAWAELAAINIQRGNAHFLASAVDECLKAHRRARVYAERAEDQRLLASALGGLGDGEYLGGRMDLSREHFLACVAICEQHGYRREEASNRVMVGWSSFFCGDVVGAYEQLQRAQVAALDSYNRRAEMIGAGGVAVACTEMGRFDEAREHGDNGLDIARRLGAYVFESAGLMYLARIAALEGERQRSAELADESLRIVREHGALQMAAAPMAALRARLASDSAEREAAIVEGRRWLENPATMWTSHVWFHQDAGEARLEAGELDLTLEHADALDGLVRLPGRDYASLVARRLRVLVRDRKGDGADARAELEDLHKRLTAAGSYVLRRKIERVLAGEPHRTGGHGA